MQSLPVARLGDEHTCPMHGVNAIVTASTASTADHLPIARLGDLTACGAVIMHGESSVPVDSLPVAYLGSPTSHGGVITSASESMFVGVQDPCPEHLSVRQPDMETALAEIAEKLPKSDPLHLAAVLESNLAFVSALTSDS